MGLPLSEIRAMSEADLRLYALYAENHALPCHRQDWYAAQTAYYVAACMGGYKGKVQDFMLQSKQKAAPQVPEFDNWDDWDT